jgi:hypothetical protein
MSSRCAIRYVRVILPLFLVVGTCELRLDTAWIGVQLFSEDGPRHAGRFCSSDRVFFLFGNPSSDRIQSGSQERWSSLVIICSPLLVTEPCECSKG